MNISGVSDTVKTQVRGKRLIKIKLGIASKEGGPHRGGVAQLGEHLPCKQGVKSSNLSISTRRKQLNESEPKGSG